MYKNNESFIAEGHGMAVGRRLGEETGYKNGQQNGYEQGHTDGWNEAILIERPKFSELRQQLEAITRERDDLREAITHAGKQTKKWLHGFNSLLCILDSAMDVLQNAPQAQRTKMVMDYAKRAEYMKSKEMIHVMPTEDLVVKTRAPRTAAQMKGWWDQVIAHARKAAERTQSESPTP